MRHAKLVLCCFATLLSGCVSFTTRAPARIDAPLHTVFQQARNGNWRLRVYTNSVHEGRVSFVDAISARVGTTRVPLDEIRRVERSYESDLGGKRPGAIVGAVLGAGVGYLGVGFWEYGNERNCDFFCQGRIYVPVVALFTTVGALTGAAVDPPTREWTTIWTR